MKHSVFRLLFSALLALLAPLAVMGQDAFRFDGINYQITSKENLTVKVVGYPSAPYAGDIVIPASATNNGVRYDVTGIEMNAFSNCTDLTSITIPASVNSIDMFAFRNCSALTAIVVDPGNPVYDSRDHCNAIIETASNTLIAGCQTTLIPATVTSIGHYAFYGCGSLSSIVIPNGVTYIGSGAFADCSLVSVEISKSVTNIEASAFGGTPWYENQPDGLVYIGSIAYKYKGTMPDNTSVVLREGTTAISSMAFYGCSGLTAISIPNSVTSIGSQAFWNCSSLTSIAIPDLVTSVEAYTFNGCTSLTSVTNGKSLTNIGDYAFQDCSSLVSIETGNGLTSIGKYAFRNCSSLVSFDMCNSVTSIGFYSFSGCSSLVSVTNGNALTSIDHYAFFGCSSLATFEVGDAMTSIGGFALTDTPWFNNLPDGLIYIGSVAYKYKGTMPSNTSIVLKEGTTEIAATAFEKCSNLVSISIPSSVETVGYRAFSSCWGLDAVNITDLAAWCNIDFLDNGSSSPNPLKYAKKLFLNGVEAKDIVIPNSVTKIKKYAFGEYKNLTSVIIPNSVTSIEESAFYNCGNLASVVIGSGVEKIESYAFEQSGVTSVTIPNSVKTMGKRAFYQCRNLTSAVIGNSVITIGERAFEQCSNLNSLKIGKSVRSIGNDAFSSCGKLTSVCIPNSVEGIGYSAFSNCFGLTSVSLGESVKGIGGYAFNCCGITSIIIPSSVEEIGPSAFNYCGLTTVVSLIEHPFEIYGKQAENSFQAFYEKTFDEALLYVPEGTLNQYQSTNGWKDFVHIVEGVPDALRPVLKDASTVEYYQLNGLKSTRPQHGINILRMNDGTSRKVVVR